MAVKVGIRNYSAAFDLFHYRPAGNSTDAARDQILDFETDDTIGLLPLAFDWDFGIGTDFTFIDAGARDGERQATVRVFFDGDADADLTNDGTAANRSTLTFDGAMPPVVNNDVASLAKSMGKIDPLAADMVKAVLLADMARIGLLADYSESLPDVLGYDQRVDPILLPTHDLGI